MTTISSSRISVSKHIQNVGRPSHSKLEATVKERYWRAGGTEEAALLNPSWFPALPETGLCTNGPRASRSWPSRMVRNVPLSSGQSGARSTASGRVWPRPPRTRGQPLPSVRWTRRRTAGGLGCGENASQARHPFLLRLLGGRTGRHLRKDKGHLREVAVGRLVEGSRPT